MSGGVITQVTQLHSRHGNGGVRRVVEGVLEGCRKGTWRRMVRWCVEGELEGGEFFVKEDKGVEGGAGVWGKRYWMDVNEIVPGVSEGMAEEVRRLGRGINFLKICCGKVHQGIRADGWDKVDTPMLEKEVSAACRKIDVAVVDSIKGEGDLLQHLEALKRFMLLGQGDFVSALLDLVGEELSKRADYVYRHNLVGVLDIALRGTNAQFMDKGVLERVGVKLYEPAPGDSGWDIFSLDYHISDPLTAIVTPEASGKYRRIFHLLWRLKRIEWGLNNTWRRATGVNHAMRKTGGGGMGRAIRGVSLVRQEMLHVTSNIQNYLMFEVIEGSWNELKSAVESAATLDDLIDSHEEYLDNILYLGLLGEDEESRDIQHLLSGLFDIADRFCALQDRVFVDCLSELGGDRARNEVRVRWAGGGGKSGNNLKIIRGGHGAIANTEPPHTPTRTHTLAQQRRRGRAGYRRGSGDTPEPTTPTLRRIGSSRSSGRRAWRGLR